MGHLLGSGWFVFLITVVKLEAQKNPPPSVDSKCLGSVLYMNVGPLGGQSLEVAALHNGSSVVLPPGIAFPCGLRIKTSPTGNTIVLASLQNCFAKNVGNDFTTTLNLRLLGNQMVEDELYQLVKTCRYTAWASREIVCNSNYMEVSVRRTASNDYTLPRQSFLGSKLGRAAEEKMQVTEAQRMYLITNTATRLFLISPTTSPETFTEDVSGVTMTVLKTSITFETKWMGTRINVAVACPTLESSIVFTENSIRWFLPQYISPLISGQFQLLEVHVGIDGIRLDPAEMEARQYSLTVGEVYIVLEIPIGAVGGHIKSSVQDNNYYALYEVEPMLELLWTEGAAHQDTRYKVFLPVVTPRWLQSVYVTDNTNPEKQFFDLLLGSFGSDVFLMNISFPMEALSVDECNARGFNILEHTFPGSSSKFFTLQVPFADPNVLQTREMGEVVFSLHLTFGLLVVPEFTPFFHTTNLEARLADAVPPSISGGCEGQNFNILVTYGTQDFNFVTTVGKQQLTSSLAREYSLMENGTHLSLLVPFTCSNVAYEAVEATSIRSRIDVALLDPQTKTTVKEFSLSCTFNKILTECFPNGTITALAVKLESVPSLNPSQLVLEDPSCGPTYSDDRYAYFVFTGNSCGTTRRFFYNMMVYENEISLPDGLEMTKTKDEPEYELKVYCYYDINETHAVTFNSRSRRSEPYADDAKGQLKVEIRVASDDTYTLFHTDANYPVIKYLQEPVYFEVELKGTKLTDVSLELDSCWATLDSDRLSQPRWNLIINGCMNPVDPYQVIFHPVRVDERVHYPSHYKRFEVQMFAFAKDDNDLSHQVFVHCDVMICDSKKPQDGICNKSCSKETAIKGQRRAVLDDRRLLHVLLGPILVI